MTSISKSVVNESKEAGWNMDEREEAINGIMKKNP